jgi:8-hydroxy-5-deazaflavin:NADPH oxidoreductase
MKIGIFGTGIVGSTIGKKLVELGHDVMMGSRKSGNENALKFVKDTDNFAKEGSFADAARHGELIFNCTKGEVALKVLEQAGKENLRGKILVDVSNPLDFSKGFPPSLTICNDDSVGETLQRSFPDLKVVKALNTVNCALMVNPSALSGEHDLFICGNDSSSKEIVTEILKKEFGWRKVIDLGDISNSRGTEMLLPLWTRLYGKLGHANFNFHINIGSR